MGLLCRFLCETSNPRWFTASKYTTGVAVKSTESSTEKEVVVEGFVIGTSLYRQKQKPILMRCDAMRCDATIVWCFKIEAWLFQVRGKIMILVCGNRLLSFLGIEPFLPSPVLLLASLLCVRLRRIFGDTLRTACNFVTLLSTIFEE